MIERAADGSLSFSKLKSKLMQQNKTNKKKIINDPVYGFIKIPTDLFFDILEHPYIQRLRRIRQLGLSYLVYPGAIHTRFQHVLGAYHLMAQAIEIIRSKGHEITEEEAEAVSLAILMHDIGHGPFSHTLERTIIDNVTHENLSLLFMDKLNEFFHGRLSMAISIFKGEYPKIFLHQLVSGQLDMDRLDYLKRDSFFTGVSEGIISSDRIIKMLEVVNDKLVVEAKGIYSIEKFLIARRLMYWQVYLHKTCIAADQMLINILKRAKELAENGVELFCTPALHFFLYKKITLNDFSDSQNEALTMFTGLDDDDVMTSIKVWASHSDFILSYLCKGITNRKLYHIDLQKQSFSEEKHNTVKTKVQKHFNLHKNDLDYLVVSGHTSNNAYYADDEKINILYNNGDLIDIAEASDMFNMAVIAKTEKKYFLCYPKEIIE